MNPAMQQNLNVAAAAAARNCAGIRNGAIGIATPTVSGTLLPIGSPYIVDLRAQVFLPLNAQAANTNTPAHLPAV